MTPVDSCTVSATTVRRSLFVLEQICSLRRPIYPVGCDFPRNSDNLFYRAHRGVFLSRIFRDPLLGFLSGNPHTPCTIYASLQSLSACFDTQSPQFYRSEIETSPLALKDSRPTESGTNIDGFHPSVRRLRLPNLSTPSPGRPL